MIYFVCGSNVFRQWQIPSLKIEIPKEISFSNNEIRNAKLMCISWSYNIFKHNGQFYLTGAFRDCDSAVIKLELPEDYKSNINSVIVGNEYSLFLFDNTNNKFWKYDFNDEKPWNWIYIPNFILNESYDVIDEKRKRTEELIIKAVTMNEACVCLTSNGSLYNIPKRVDTSMCDGTICDVVCGYEHAVALTNNGIVYTWGKGRCQLGCGKLTDQSETLQPVEALLGIKIIKIAAGGWHSLALSYCGDVYTWGWNEHGQLGITENNVTTSQVTPTLVDFYDENGTLLEINVKDIACGSRHSAVLDTNNALWTAGLNTFGQTGDDLKKKNTDKFKKVLQVEKDSELSCGPWVTVVTIQCNV